MFDVVVVGSINIDTTASVARLPGPGETVMASRHFFDNGGKGANQAVAAARLGASVAMIGRVGPDGAASTEALRAAGVDVSGVAVGEAPTGQAFITVDAVGENMIVVSAGANGELAADDVSSLTASMPATVTLAQLEIPLAAVRAGAAAGGTFVLNPAPAAELPSDLLGEVDVLVPNATELATLAGGMEPSNPDEAIDMARSLQGPGAVVVTLGSAGAVIWDGRAVAVQAPVIDAVDPTAAGDAFCGALAVALAGGADLRSAVELGVRAGALAATRWGAQGSLPTKDELDHWEGP